MISYDLEPAPVAERFAGCHRQFWERMATPGTWLSAAQRVAVAAEARVAMDCPACRERKTALSPETDVGEHASAGVELPEDWRELIHRICTDASRLSRGWYQRVTAEVVSHGRHAGSPEKRESG